MNIHVCYGISDRCYNLEDSCGEICVHCNCCGRIDRKTMWIARYETDKQHLIETVGKINQIGYLSDTQQENIIKDISYFRKRLEISRKHLPFTEPIEEADHDR